MPSQTARLTNVPYPVTVPQRYSGPLGKQTPRPHTASELGKGCAGLRGGQEKASLHRPTAPQTVWHCRSGITVGAAGCLRGYLAHPSQPTAKQSEGLDGATGPRSQELGSTPAQSNPCIP